MGEVGDTPHAASPAESEAAAPSGTQGTLFDDGRPMPPAEDVGYRGPTACHAAGISYRQLDYWARTELVEPTIRPAAGSGGRHSRARGRPGRGRTPARLRPRGCRARRPWPRLC